MEMDQELSGVSAETAWHIEKLGDEAISSETLRSYRAAARYVDAWYELRFGEEATYPFLVQHVLTFIADHVEVKRGVKLVTTMPREVAEGLVERGVKKKNASFTQSTVMHRLAVMSRIHSNQVSYDEGQVNPFDTREVKKAIKDARQALAKRGVRAQQKTALTGNLMAALLEACKGDGLRGLRDAAILLFAFSSGGRRRSEVASATFDQLTPIRERVRDRNGKLKDVWSFTFRLGKSKTNQTGAQDRFPDKPIKGVAAEALIAWVNAAGIRSGPLFRGISSKDGVEIVSETALQPDSIRQVVRRRAKQADLVGADKGAYSAHSLRSGFVTESGKRKAPMLDAMRMTEHRSVAMFSRYYQAGELAESPAARLMDDALDDAFEEQGKQKAQR